MGASLISVGEFLSSVGEFPCSGDESGFQCFGVTTRLLSTFPPGNFAVFTSLINEASFQATFFLFFFR